MRTAWSVPAGGPRAAITGKATVVELIEAAAKAFGPRVALTDGDRSMTYRELPRVAQRVAATLKQHGIRPGDRVMVMAGNRLGILEALLGCAWGGGVLVPLNPALPLAQVRYFLEYIRPSLVIADDPGQDLGRACTDRGIAVRSFDGGLASWQPGADGPSAQTAVDASTTLAILPTSGTTGVSKGVLSPHGQFIAWGELVGRQLGYEPGDVAYTCLPLFHTNALNAAMQCWVHGATFHIGPKFSVSQFWDRVRSSGATSTYLLGAMVSMLLTAPPSDRDRDHGVTRILAPGTPVDAVVAFERRFGATLLEGHGMTETNLTIAPPTGRERRLGSMGTEVEGFEASVVDELDRAVADGTVGELVLRSNLPFAFSTGYWEMPDVTVAANRNQWFHTGDRVVREDGWYRFVDRVKDVIRRRGENVSAWEVEQALQAVPGVDRCAVIPVPSELGEDEVFALIVPGDGAALEPARVVEACRSALPAYAVPRFIEFVDALPLTDTGRVQKGMLRERGLGPGAWDAARPSG